MKPVADRLLAALVRHIGPLSAVHVQTTPWASATFSGARHMLWFDAMAGAPLDAFRHDLHAIDLPMPGAFVADIEMIERTVKTGFERIGLAVLTIDEA